MKQIFEPSDQIISPSNIKISLPEEYMARISTETSQSKLYFVVCYAGFTMLLIIIVLSMINAAPDLPFMR